MIIKRIKPYRKESKYINIEDNKKLNEMLGDIFDMTEGEQKLKSALIQRYNDENFADFALYLTNFDLNFLPKDNIEDIAYILLGTGQIYVNRNIDDLACLDYLIRHEMLHQFLEHEARANDYVQELAERAVENLPKSLKALFSDPKNTPKTEKQKQDMIAAAVAVYLNIAGDFEISKFYNDGFNGPDDIYMTTHVQNPDKSNPEPIQGLLIPDKWYNEGLSLTDMLERMLDDDPVAELYRQMALQLAEQRARQQSAEEQSKNAVGRIVDAIEEAIEEIEKKKELLKNSNKDGGSNLTSSNDSESEKQQSKQPGNEQGQGGDSESKQKGQEQGQGGSMGGSQGGSMVPGKAGQGGGGKLRPTGIKIDNSTKTITLNAEELYDAIKEAIENGDADALRKIVELLKEVQKKLRDDQHKAEIERSKQSKEAISKNISEIRKITSETDIGDRLRLNADLQRIAELDRHNKIVDKARQLAAAKLWAQSQDLSALPKTPDFANDFRQALQRLSKDFGDPKVIDTYRKVRRSAAVDAVYGLQRKGHKEQEVNRKNKPTVFIYMDCSGSFAGNEPKWAAERSAIANTYTKYMLKEKKIEGALFFVTEKITRADDVIFDTSKEAMKAGDLNLKGLGGGGADGNAILDHINTYKPDNVIIITDSDARIEEQKRPAIIPGYAWILYSLAAANLENFIVPGKGYTVYELTYSGSDDERGQVKSDDKDKENKHL